jgi:hypothetical protein
MSNTGKKVCEKKLCEIKICENSINPSKEKNTLGDNNPSSSEEDTMTNYNVEWSRQHENILVEWADKAICYRWLHSTSQINYSFKNRWFTVPVIIMSTLTGTANFAQERIPSDYRAIFSVSVGAVNILAGIITTVQQFLKISELNEAHRASSISWDKFYRNIKLELAKSRCERMPAYQMLKISKEEFDRLMETSPSIEKKILKKFNSTFSGGPVKDKIELNEKQRNFKELCKPEICDVLESTRNFIYTETAEDIAKKKTSKLVDFVKENNEFRRKSVVVNKFMNDFNVEYKREPTVEEIHDNLRTHVSSDIINTVIRTEKNV